MWKKNSLLLSLCLLVAAGALVGLPVTGQHAPAPAAAASPGEVPPPEAQPPDLGPAESLEELLRQELALKCNEYPNPRCDPNTDPNCFCDPSCDPDADPNCVICEDQCAGPMVDPTG